VSILTCSYAARQPKAVLTNTRAERGKTSLLAIRNLYDVEEDIWCPTYGLKGKLDASVEVVITDSTSSRSDTSLPRPVPLEIKTGRSLGGLEHRAQTMLYTLLMGERYGVQVSEGLLYYTQNEEVIRVPAARHEIRGLIGVRNRIAEAMTRRFRNLDQQPTWRGYDEEPSFLPPTIDDERICGRCFALDACMLYRRVRFLIVMHLFA